MEAYYTEVLENFQIGDALKLGTAEPLALLKELLPQLYFYLELPEQTKSISNTSSLLYEGRIKKRNSTLVDHLEMQKLDEIYEKLVQLYDKNISPNDVLELKEIMSSSIFGNLNETRSSLPPNAFGDYRDNKRRYFLLLGDFYMQ